MYHQYTVRVTDDATLDRDGLAAALAARGVGSGVYYPRVVFDYDCFLDDPRVKVEAVPHARRAAREVLSLPVHPGLTRADVDRVVEAVARRASEADRPLRRSVVAVLVGRRGRGTILSLPAISDLVRTRRAARRGATMSERTQRAPLRVALVGRGAWGPCTPGSSPSPRTRSSAVVVDPSAAVGEPVAEQYRSRWVADVDSFDDFDAVIVAAPTDVHLEWARRSLDSGRPVLVEKPVSLAIAEHARWSTGPDSSTCRSPAACSNASVRWCTPRSRS